MSLQLAEQLESNEQYNEALAEYKKELEHNPDDLGILERLGHISLILEKIDDAANYYNEILKKDVTNALAYEQLISIYANRDKYKYYIYRGNKNSLEGKLDFAINDFKKAIEHCNDGVQKAMTRLTLANLYRKSGKTMKAIDEFNMLLEGEDLHEEMFLELADIYLSEGAYPSAIDTLNRAKQKGFDTLNVNEGLANIYLKNGEAQKALDITKDELLKIQCMLELGQVKEAYEKLEKIPDEFKKHPRYLTLNAQYYYSAKDWDKALEAVEEYNKVVPNSPLTYQMNALIYEGKNDEYNAHVNWGRYYILRKDVDMATHEFLNAVQLNDRDTDLLFELAQLLTDNGEVDHASEYYNRIVELEPENKEALTKLAQYKQGLGDYGTAAKYLEKIINSNPRDLYTLKELGMTYEKMKATSKACNVYKNYLEHATDPSDIKIIQDKVAKLESMGLSDAEDSEGLIDKIMKLFNK